MSAPLLEVRGLRCSFGDVAAVRGVDLTLYPGEILGLVGESGSGKTLTMRAVMNLLPPNASREGTVGGTCLSTPADGSARSCAMIFQDPMTSLDPLTRVDVHLEEVLRRRRRLSRTEARAETLSLLTRVGIDDPAGRAAQYPHELSGGMRQRVLIAMALACRPRLLIADEPTTALDVTIQAQILGLLRSLRDQEGMAVILITHDMGVVATLCHRVAVMYAGVILEEGPVDALFARPLHPYTRALLRSAPSMSREAGAPLEAIRGQPPSIFALPPGCPFAPRCPEASPPCERALPPLGDRGGGRAVRCLRGGEGEDDGQA